MGQKARLTPYAVRRFALRLLSLVALVGMLSGCLPAVMSTGHRYLLAVEDDRFWRVLSDDDPAYARFEAQVLEDAFLSRLLGILDGAAKGVVAARFPSRAPQTVANAPCILLDSRETGVIRRVRLERGAYRMRVELALGLGHEGAEDLAWAQQHLAREIASMLYEMASQHPQPSPSVIRVYEATTPDRALAEGLAGAIDTLHAYENPALLDALRDGAALSPTLADRLLRYEYVPVNGFRVRFAQERPTGEMRSYAEALSTPGVVAAFFYRLLQQASPNYPQRYMLWFANFDPSDIAYAKVLLALTRMRASEPSLETFVASYRETFPAERDAVESLAREILGDGRVR